MKVWRFYVDSTTIRPELLPKDSDRGYTLYAFTNHKDMAKKFMSDRNMDNFKVVTSDMSKTEYIEFANGDSNNNFVLDYRTYNTKCEDGPLYDIEKVELLTTMWEYLNCVDDGFGTNNIAVMNGGWWDEMPAPNLYDKSLLKHLDVLRYSKLYSLILGVSLDSYDEDDDYSSPDVYVDELSLFISLFIDTFTNDTLKEI